MKRRVLFFCIFILIFMQVIAFSQEGNKSEAYDYFFKDNINKEISVDIAYIDISITGTLVKVYPDGILIRSLFNEVYIPKVSIAFVKRKLTDEERDALKK